MIIDGKKIAEELLDELAQKVKTLSARPTLAVLQVGKLAASSTYIRMKQKACAKVGIESELHELPNSISEQELLAWIDKLNSDEKVTGILLQLPLPSHLDPHRMLEAIDPTKDVDGFHPLNMGKLLLGLEGLIPCTPLGIHTLLQKSGISVEGKNVVIAGRSSIVGLPLAALLMQKKPGCNATVTVAHSKTPNLKEVTKKADILIAAMGKPRLITADMVQEGAVVIDVGINKVEGKLVGDVDFDAVLPKCKAITPVPGGVGPMTVAMLLHNTVKQCAD